MASQDATQPATQQVLDPRRFGNSNSGLADHDATDIILILTAVSPAAAKVVQNMARLRPEHVYYGSNTSSGLSHDIEEQETIIIQDGLRLGQSPTPLGLALRLSSLSNLMTKENGFVFGRNVALSDIVFGHDSGRRISNQHFRIYFNEDGLLMIRDTSTNGTLVDSVLLRSKEPHSKSARMIMNGAEIQITYPNAVDTITFSVRTPSRGVHAARYEEKKLFFISECAVDGDKERVRKRLSQRAYRATMRWDGGDLYNIIGELGTGAFATVHQIATKMDGKVLAAKALEKRKFMKNGQLDKKLQDEINIMKGLRHPNIIEFVECHDQVDYVYIIMEYAPHGDLQHYLKRRGPMKEEMARPLAQQVISALHYLHHRAKVTHRDIKPDNILISNLEPLHVKITDFGLSKSVEKDEDFMKTFCGTLLYCAPEVFPEFNSNHHGTKRRRGEQRKDYSSSVDIWSFGGVLWFALCGVPPFKGISDATGEGMYNNIMRSRLDPTPLRERNVSEECIDLLTRMLQIDPSTRPTELECLSHPWLKGGPMPEDPTLQSIVEEDEGEDEAEQQFSQLSLGREIPELDDEAGYLSDEFELLLDSRQSKRVRTDPLFPRNQMRDYEDSSADASFLSAHDMALDAEDSLRLMPAPHSQRLFGEIGQSAFHSSTVLNEHAHQALTNEGSTAGIPGIVPFSSYIRGRARMTPTAGAVPQLDEDLPSTSLLGTEAMVREMNMASPHSPGSGPDADEPPTPKTPEVPQRNSFEHGKSQTSEPTPKARIPTLNRTISLPKTASLYWDPYNKETHTLEYASKVSGFDFVGAQQASAGVSEMADTMRQSTDDEFSSDAAQALQQLSAEQLSADPDIKPPPRRLGKLAATPDSFTPGLVLNIDRSRTSWGRLKTNTIVYENGNDTRISKAAFIIFWWSSQADLRENVQILSQQGKDWPALDDLHVGIFTCATSGITINGKHMTQRDGKGRDNFGELHTGDIIQVYHDHRSSECLKFKCEFYLGAGKEPRSSGNSFAVLHSSKLPA